MYSVSTQREWKLKNPYASRLMVLVPRGTVARLDAGQSKANQRWWKMIRALAVDPGKTTGYCLAFSGDEIELQITQGRDDVSEFWKVLNNTKPEHLIVEKFEFRRGNWSGAGHGGAVDLFPVQLIGVARLYSWNGNECQLHMQSPAMGKSYYTDMILKNNGFYKRGTPHGRDAERHMLHWLKFGYGHQFVQDGTKVTIS
jgi:hypothetical protein